MLNIFPTKMCIKLLHAVQGIVIRECYLTRLVMKYIWYAVMIPTCCACFRISGILNVRQSSRIWVSPDDLMSFSMGLKLNGNVTGYIPN